MAGKKARERIDVLVVAGGHAPSRERAQALIRAGKIIVNDERIDKPGTRVPVDGVIRIKGNVCPYVSRGGYKLVGALQNFNIDATGRTALDVGSSTGGFTDVLLKHGAEQVIAVDVGTNQLDYSLRQDPRVTVMEKTNFRTIGETAKADVIRGKKPNLVVGDVSFISLTLILPSIPDLVQTPADIIFLVKPQFEVGRGEIGKGGIVKSAEAREASLKKIADFCSDTLKWKVCGTMTSPIQGTQGNIEFLLHARIEN